MDKTRDEDPGHTALAAESWAALEVLPSVDATFIPVALILMALMRPMLGLFKSPEVVPL